MTPTLESIDDTDLTRVIGGAGFDIGSLMSSAPGILQGITGLIGAFKGNKGGSAAEAPAGSETAAAAQSAAAPQAAGPQTQTPSDPGQSAGGIPGVSISISINGVRQV